MPDPRHPRSIDDLLQTRLTETLLEDLRSVCPELFAQHRSVLETPLDDPRSKDALGQLQTSVKSIVDAIREEVRDDADAANAARKSKLKAVAKRLKSEWKEIKDDATYRRSKRYERMKQAEAWFLPWIAEFRQHPEFNDVFVGIHDSEFCPFLTGRVDDKETLDRLEAFLATKDPPENLRIRILTQPKRRE